MTVAKQRKSGRRPFVPKWRRRRRIWIPVAVVALAVAGIAADWWSALPEGAEAEYVGRRSCIECHQQQSERWTGSHHDLAMAVADESTVRGDFNDRVLEHHGVTTRIFRKEDGFYMETEGPDGERGVFRVKYTFGIEPLQQYLTELPRGHVQVLPATWDTEKEEWYYAVPDAPFGPDDPLHWTGSAQNWNHMCADCHSTNFQKNYDVDSNTHHYSYSEIDVSCEACHGAGSLHVELANSPSLFWDRRHGYGLVKLKRQDPQPQLEVCAPCHSRRNHIYPGYAAGDRFLDHFELSLLEENLYHPDGQIDDEVYVYGSFLQSLMYRKGVRCTDCHDPHSTEVKYDDNRLCTQCHVPAKYDVPGHHHHPRDSRGAACVACHMPSKKYMVVDPRRDHSLRVPRPDLTVKLGVPNACNDCHTQEHETAQWAADKVVEWYGPERKQDPHFGEIIHAGRQGKPEAEEPLARLARDRDAGPIVRATAVSLLARSYAGEETHKTIQRALTSHEPLSRHAALQFFDAHPPRSAAGLRRLQDNLVPLLDDPVRSVRVEATRVTAPWANRVLNSGSDRAFEAALAEYKRGLRYHGDQSGSHMSLAILFEQLGRPDKAAREYRTAIRLEPAVAGPRSNLAELLSRQGNERTAHRLREEEVELLQRDVGLLPDNAALHYRLGLARYLLNELDRAEDALKEAVRLEPDNTRFLLTLTLLYDKQQRWDEAVKGAKRLTGLDPSNPMYSQLLSELKQKR